MAAKEIPFDSTLALRKQVGCRFYDADSSHYAGLKAPATVTASLDYTLPAAGPASSGYVLSATTAGVMSWVENGSGGSSVTGEEYYSGSVTTIGSDTQTAIASVDVSASGGTLIEVTAAGYSASDGGAWAVRKIMLITNPLGGAGLQEKPFAITGSLVYDSSAGDVTFGLDSPIGTSTADILIVSTASQTITWRVIARVIVNDP